VKCPFAVSRLFGANNGDGDGGGGGVGGGGGGGFERPSLSTSDTPEASWRRQEAHPNDVD